MSALALVILCALLGASQSAPLFAAEFFRPMMFAALFPVVATLPAVFWILFFPRPFRTERLDHLGHIAASAAWGGSVGILLTMTATVALLFFFASDICC